jgi:purine-nucleoside phosphorylase
MRATNSVEYVQCIQEAADFILKELGPAKIALVLGSGLGPFVDFLTETKEVDFKDIPHMPSTSVEANILLFVFCFVSFCGHFFQKGHKGKLILGTVSGKRILCLAGRIHPYEGYHMFQLTFMTRVMKRVGVELYVTTNSSGGCQRGMKKGCIMAIRDHMNWFHRSPLLEVPELSECHVDTRRVYSSRLLTVARRTAKTEAVQLFEGNLCLFCLFCVICFFEITI